MFKSMKTTAVAGLGTALALCSTLLLAGCGATNAAIDDIAGSNAYYDRYPIKVKQQAGTNRKVAVTRECGDWSDNLAVTSSNTPYRNLGCAYQNNVAAMVANPRDFERPRAVTAVSAANRTTAATIYYKSPETAFDPASVISTSN